MDAQTIKRAIYDLFKFNPKDFRVAASPTGFQISLNSKPSPREKVQPFEVSVVSVDTSEADPIVTVECAVGTVLEDEEDIESIAEILEADATFEMEEGDWIILKVEFDAEGAITTCTLQKVNEDDWTDYPSLFEIVESEEDTNIWRHPIAHLRQQIGETPSPLEFPVVDNLVLSQKTNTHLVVVRACVNGNLIWKLQPGEGGKDMPPE